MDKYFSAVVSYCLILCLDLVYLSLIRKRKWYAVSLKFRRFELFLSARTSWHLLTVLFIIVCCLCDKNIYSVELLQTSVRTTDYAGFYFSLIKIKYCGLNVLKSLAKFFKFTGTYLTFYFECLLKRYSDNFRRNISIYLAYC